jgi:hypothetical protein
MHRVRRADVQVEGPHVLETPDQLEMVCRRIPGEMNSSEADTTEIDRVEPQWDGDDSVASESSTH